MKHKQEILKFKLCYCHLICSNYINKQLNKSLDQFKRNLT